MCPVHDEVGQAEGPEDHDARHHIGRDGFAERLGQPGPDVADARPAPGPGPAAGGGETGRGLRGPLGCSACSVSVTPTTGQGAEVTYSVRFMGS